ncbi:hypothetical protein K8R62_01670 [bacterium]|nr:hypothetical protein [bacterium]
MVEFSCQFKQDDLVKKSTKELLDLYKKFNNIFLNFYGYATLMALMGYSQDNALYKKADRTLKEKTRNCPEKFAEYLVTLTNPQQRLKSKDFELEILKITKDVKKSANNTKFKIKKNYKDKIDRLKEKWEWMTFDFTNNSRMNDDYLVNLIFEKFKIDIDGKIEEIKNYEKITKKEFNKLAKKLKLNKEEISSFQFISDLGYYKWAREYGFQGSYYNLKFLQDEIGRRKKLNSLENKYLLVDELKYLSDEELKKIAQERMKFSFMIYDIKKGLQSLVGKATRDRFEKIKFTKLEIDKKLEKIKGTPARAGIVKGVVKIVNTSEDMFKMKKGNILVSVATTPEIIVAMKKAAGIITDEGGITCHAAIVSRELGIPCVVGTRMATQVLKHGDMVEVDANKGIVKLIK